LSKTGLKPPPLTSQAKCYGNELDDQDVEEKGDNDDDITRIQDEGDDEDDVLEADATAISAFLKAARTRCEEHVDSDVSILDNKDNPDHNKGRSEENDKDDDVHIVRIKRSHLLMISKWITDCTDFETDAHGNVTKLRPTHLPGTRNGCTCVQGWRFAALSRFFGGPKNKHLITLDLSRLSDLRSLRGSEFIRLSTLKELILPGQKIEKCSEHDATFRHNECHECEDTKNHHKLLGNTFRFDLDMHDRPGSCAVVAKNGDESIWDSVVHLQECLIQMGWPKSLED
jgi:hypothetical protein